MGIHFAENSSLYTKVLLYDNDRDNGDEDVNLKEINGDSNEDVIYNFIDDVSNMVARVNCKH